MWLWILMLPFWFAFYDLSFKVGPLTWKPYQKSLSTVGYCERAMVHIATMKNCSKASSRLINTKTSIRKTTSGALAIRTWHLMIWNEWNSYGKDKIVKNKFDFISILTNRFKWLLWWSDKRKTWFFLSIGLFRPWVRTKHWQCSFLCQ